MTPDPRKERIRLNLGCGFRRLPGYVNVDCDPQCGPDVLLDLESTPWPWVNDCVEEVQLIHVLEHLGRTPEKFLAIMRELYRVCVHGAAIHIVVPHHRHDNFASDPTHVRPITPLGLALFDRAQCEYWVRNGFANTPLALYCGVDFVTESQQHDIDERWQQRLDAGLITRAQLEEAALHQANVITQSRFLLRVRKAEGHSITNLRDMQATEGAAEDLLTRAKQCIDRADWQEALAWCEETLARFGANHLAHHLAGYAAGRLGRRELATFHHQAAVQHAPEVALYRYNLAVDLGERGRENEAAIQYQYCLRKDPNYLDALWNYGEMLRLAEHFALAAGLFERFAAKGGAYEALDHRLGVCYAALGQDAEAEACFRRALSTRTPPDELTHWEFALFLLSRERFAEGFAHYQRRFLASGRNSVACHPFPFPLWQGEFTPGGTLLIHGEQGLGDEMMFASVLPEVLEKAGQAGCRVILGVKPPLVRLFASSFPDAIVRPHRVIDAPLDVSEFGTIDWQLPIGDLAVLFRRTAEDFARGRRPYLFADPERAKWYADRLSAMEGPADQHAGRNSAAAAPVLKVGLAWGANPAPVNERFMRWTAQRSIPAPMLERFASLRPAVRFISLHNQERGAEAALAPSLDIFDLSELQTDFFETAALITNLDLVISVDTSIAHLAGAMGKETWVPLMRRCDWRHGRERDSSYWYPNVRYFRQITDGDWSGPLEAMAEALRERVRAGRAEATSLLVASSADYTPALERALHFLRERELDHARPHFEAALRQSNDRPQVRWEYAMQLLTEGLSQLPDPAQADEYLARGWDYYEARHEVFGWERLHLCPLPWPRWRGEPLAGHTIFVHGEQGVGDEIMAASMLPDLVAMGARVIVACLPNLTSLFTDSIPGISVVPHVRGRPNEWSTALPQWTRMLATAPGGVDYHIPMMSLGQLLRRKASDFPRKAYLRAHPERIAGMAQKLEALAQAQSPDAPKPKIRVGLAWCGSLKSDSARRRAVPLRALLPLLDAGAPGDILFVSLQSREFAAQMAEVPEFPLLDMSSLTDDFADLAAVIANLDLVVSVDTSYAHLSAALGVPTWRMLPKRYDWRWGWGRQDSPWYPIDRQFWQTTEGNWAPVIDAIKNELGSLLAEPVDSHSPEWLQARILAATACIAPT